MMRQLVGLGIAVVLTGSAIPAQAQQSPLRLDRLMSPEERAATGVNSLSAAQRSALEAWLARYTATVSAVAQHQGAPVAERAPAPTVIAPAPGRAGPAQYDTIRPPRVLRPPRAVGNGAYLLRASGGGTYLLLADGTLWEVKLEDRPAADGWREGDFVLVRNNPAPTGSYEFYLVNPNVSLEYGRRVVARIAGFVRPAETPSAPPAQ